MKINSKQKVKSVGFDWQIVKKTLKIKTIIKGFHERNEEIPKDITMCLKCGIVLFRRHLYDDGWHDNDVQGCEIEYREIPDERLLKNFNELYNLIILKYG